MLRASTTRTLVVETQEEQRDGRVAALVEEAERLKVTIAKQQEEITALQEQKQQERLAPAPLQCPIAQPQMAQPELVKPQPDKPLQQIRQLQQEPEQLQPAARQQQKRKPAQGGPSNVALQDAQAAQVAHEETWTCAICTFENVEPLTECEMCGVQRASSSSPPGKRQKKGPPQAVDVDAAWHIFPGAGSSGVIVGSTRVPDRAFLAGCCPQDSTSLTCLLVDGTLQCLMLHPHMALSWQHERLVETEIF